MPSYRVHIKFKRGFEDWHLFDEPSVDAALARFRRGEEHLGRKFLIEPASIVLADEMTPEQQLEMDKDKPYALDELHSGMTDAQRAAWEADNLRAADKISAELNRGAFVSEDDRLALARAKRAAQIRADPGQLTHTDAQHVNQRAVLLAPGEEPPHGAR